MTAPEAALVATWHYDGEWSVYDLDSSQPLLDGLANYHSLFAGERLIGFCCTGSAARIPGITEEPGTLDVGMGMDPTQVGRGYGAAFGEAVLGYLSMRYPGQTLRAVVQEWNERSLRLTRRLGFVDTGEATVLQCGEPVTYRVVIKGPNSDTN
jgi:RimJ/RimL family protein N-acetyltransferase